MLDLDAIRRMVLPGSIQVQRRGARRLPNLGEALSLALGALGTLNRLSGVKIHNLKIGGRPVALAVIEDAQFGEDDEGNTTLKEVEP